MPFLAVFRALVGAYARHEVGRTLLTVLGVALGVAVLVAIDLTNESALRSFRKTVEDVAGRATLTVSGASAGLEPRLAQLIREHPGVADAQLLIQGNALLPGDGDEPGARLTLLGIDMLSLGGEPAPDAPAVRDVRFELAEGIDFLALLAEPGHLVLGATAAREAGLSPGDAATLTIGGRPLEVLVAGVVDSGDFADAFGGRFALADLGNADLLLRRGGTLDRVDVVTSPGADVDAVASSLREALGDAVLVERPARRSARVDEMLGAFRFNLRALGHISLLVGAFLIYNTMSIAVVRRRTTIGTLRAMGVRRGAVRRAFLLEGALFGLVGGALGIVGGIVLAAALLGTVTEAISMNFVFIGEAGLAPSAPQLVAAFALGVAFSIAAAWGPAREASSTAPANTMRRGSDAARAVGPLPRLAGVVALSAAGLVVLAREPGAGIPWIGYTSSALFLGAFVLLIQPFMQGLAAAARRPATRAFGPEGLLAVTNARAALGRAGVATGGLMISVAMTVSVTVMIASFRGTVIDWMDDVLIADLYVSSDSADPSSPFEPMPRAFAEEVAALPGVARSDAFRGRRVVIDEKLATVAGAPFRLERFERTLVPGSRPAAEVVADAEAGRAVIVSEAFARKHARRAGDVLSVPAPAGAVELPIAGVYRDYSSEQGYVIMSPALYQSLYDDALVDSLTIWLEPGASTGATRDAIESLARARGDVPPLVVRADAELRRLALDQFDRTFGVTEVLKAIAVIVAILGVTTTLLAQILDRRDEFATLRVLGVARRRIARIILVESGIIGLGGIALGIAAGLMLSTILTKVVMLESFGWTIAFAAPPLAILQIAAIVLVATVLAGLLPAREATRAATVRPQTITG